MQKYADYIRRIEIDSLWSGKKHVVWELNRQVNILSGINGVGKSTILNKIIKSVNTNGDIINHLLKGVHIDVEPADATHIRFDIIRSLDSPMLDNETLNMVDTRIRSALDFQLFHLQRKYLDYQVNIGNRIIEQLQQGHADAAQQLSQKKSRIEQLQQGHADAAQQLSQKKSRFQDIVDDLFTDTGKKIVRTENEIRFSQIGETLVPYQLSSGEKQILAILLTVLVEDNLPYVLFMDEPEVSLHIEWQKRIIDLCLELNPNVQIILTTHSPAVVMNGWVDAVTEVTDITI